MKTLLKMSRRAYINIKVDFRTTKITTDKEDITQWWKDKLLNYNNPKVYTCNNRALEYVNQKQNREEK